MTKPPYDILFEPVRIGPVTAPNRFYQVPHCTGMGYRYPRSEAAHRGVKAEGGWGVICTQEAEIHATSDVTPANEARIWDDRDISYLRLTTEAIHQHGSLAAIELTHNGHHSANRYSRELPIAPSNCVVDLADPVQARAMDKADIREFRQWHRDAAIRAMQAGFDIVYVYAGHDMTLLQHFLLARHNHRTDEYGGSFENRLRLFREVIDDTRDAVGDRCGLAVRLAVEELLGPDGLQYDGEGRDIVAALADAPDLWDVNISGWANDSQTSRFSEEGFQEQYTGFVKSLTNKPVVGVGRYTSPDTMVRLIKTGVFDMIGGARPTIADPHLPLKIKEDRLEDIRECIGCNICVSGDNTNVPMRCTQNPTVGEEWRRGWHPEKIPPLDDPGPYLVVGGGPAGLEAARALVARGAEVTLAEASAEFGGRVSSESRLPGLAPWARVRDWRLWQLNQAGNASLFVDSPLTAAEILSYNMAHIVLATGSSWRRDGVGRAHRRPLPFLNQDMVVSPDNLMKDGAAGLAGPVVIFDDDRFYLASLLAEQCANANLSTTFVTPASCVSPWADNTLEQQRIQTRLLELGVNVITDHVLADLKPGQLTIHCTYTGRPQEIDCQTLVPVTTRLPRDEIWQDLQARQADWQDAGISTVTRIGDCLAPGLIAAAVYGGHKYARLAGGASDDILREDAVLSQPAID